MTTPTMTVEIWADVVCPWCGLGQRRLDLALASFPQRDQVRLVHRSFQLDPSFPEGQTMPVREMLKRKYGMGEAQLAETTRRIEALAAADGLSPYKVGQNQVGNTRQAHELLAFSAERGLADEAWQRLYQAYFGELRSIFGIEALVALGLELGLPETELRDALGSGRHRAGVELDGQEARDLGATGVPFVVIDRRLGVSGAQSVETFLAALVQGWEAAQSTDSHSTPSTAPGSQSPA